MSVLLVGCGYWGKNWAKTLDDIQALGAICEPNPTLRQQLKIKYPHTRFHDNIDDALSHAGIDACVIATPALTHYPIAQQCLSAAKHVLVEKPLTLDPSLAEALIQTAEQANLVLAVGHLLVYQPALIKLKALIEAGVLGDILSVQCTRINLGKIRNEENVWWNLAPHDLSILGMLLDEPLEVVNAATMTPLHREHIEDSVHATFQTPSGKTASIHVNWLSPIKRHETVVIGTEKIAVFDDTLPPAQKLTLTSYTLERNGQHVEAIRRGNTEPVEYTIPSDDLLTLQAKQFLKAVQGTERFLENSGSQALQVVQLLDSVQSLLDSRKSPRVTVNV